MSTVALPFGADPERTDKWEIDKTGAEPTYRCVWSPELFGDPQIRVGAVQLEDGTLNGGNESPTVFVDLSPMSIAKARQLAAALCAAADLATSWGGAR